MAYSYDKTYFILSLGKFLVVQPSAKTILSKYVKYWSIGCNGGLLGGFESWRTSEFKTNKALNAMLSNGFRVSVARKAVLSIEFNAFHAMF